MSDGSIQEAINKLKSTAAQPEPTESPEMPEAEPQETPEASMEQESVETDATEERGEAQEGPTDEVEAETEAERIELEADQFADLLGIKSDQIDITDDGQVRFRAKAGDEPVDVSLEKLLNAFQGDATLTNRSKELSEMRKAQEAELINLQNQTQQFAQQSASLLEGLKEQFLKPFESINWSELKEDDPGMYAAQLQDKRATEEKIAQIASQALNQINQSQQTQNEELQKQYREYLSSQEKALMDSKSELHVPNFEKAYPEIRSYMGKLGFGEEEQNQVADARLINALYKAMMFDKGSQGAKQKLAKPLPKVLKPGTSPSKSEVIQATESKLKQKLKESGSMHDAVALLKQRKR